MFEDVEIKEVETLVEVGCGESKNSKWVEGITTWMNKLENDGYKLFAMSITYKAKKEFDHDAKFLNEIFWNLYWHHLLPEKIFKNKKWIRKYKADQPILLLFSEEHQEKAVKTYSPRTTGGVEYIFPERLHHHAIVAVRSEHEAAMKSLCFENSLRQFSQWVLTSVIKPADLGWIGYAAKDLRLSLDDYQVYGPEGVQSIAVKQDSKNKE